MHTAAVDFHICADLSSLFIGNLYSSFSYLVRERRMQQWGANAAIGTGTSMGIGADAYADAGESAYYNARTPVSVPAQAGVDHEDRASASSLLSPLQPSATATATAAAAAAPAAVGLSTNSLPPLVPQSDIARVEMRRWDVWPRWIYSSTSANNTVAATSSSAKHTNGTN
jgi:hypothetical protein